MLRREAPNVLAVEEVGAYSLLRVTRGSLDRGSPGQFFMLAAPKRVLPRPMSVCAAPPGELWFLIKRAIGPGTRALCALSHGTMRALGPLARLQSRRRAPAARRRRDRDGAAAVPLGDPRAAAGGTRLSERTPCRGSGAGPERRGRDRADARDRGNARGLRRPSRAGPVRARRRRRPCPGAQLAWEAPMACGYGACYGCVVEVDGEFKRLCVEGPVLHAA